MLLDFRNLNTVLVDYVVVDVAHNLDIVLVERGGFKHSVAGVRQGVQGIFL